MLNNNKNEKVKRSSSHERSVKGYLTTSNNNFIKNYIEKNKVSQSEAVNDAVAALREKSK